MPLQTRFLSQLDVLSVRLLKLFQRRGGKIGRQLQRIVEPVAQDPDNVDLRHECIIKGPSVYINEDLENLIREYVAEVADIIQGVVEETTVGTYAIKHDPENKPEDIGIVIEGHIVLEELESAALAVAMLFGLALNLNYPPGIKNTCEVLQKLVMELECGTLSKKVQALKNRLSELLSLYMAYPLRT
ncbi:hypothetical protein FQA47_021364 [Oryzias melastigma]|uniref:Uncharacterized protein n=1 Tax=Oryzias melastigma TaxID=30732 RepID=A0A834F9P4_ORYME|nr:hypothetical protein FQA47_021364 [Oryzias melastigma]